MKTAWKCMLALMCMAMPAQAQKGNGPEEVPPPVVIKLDSFTGCWHNRQDNYQFVLTVPDGYVMIELREPAGSLSSSAQEPMGGREPFMHQINSYGSVLGMLPLRPFGDDTVIARVTKGIYGISWGPRASHGGKVLITVCFNKFVDGF